MDRFLDVPDKLGRSALDLVNHIVESGWLMAGELTSPKGDFTRREHGHLVAEHTPAGDYSKDRASALAALRRSHEEGEARIRINVSALHSTEHLQKTLKAFESAREAAAFAAAARDVFSD